MPSAAFSVPPSKHRAHPKPDVWPAEALKWFAAQPEGKAVNALYEAGKAKFERQVAEEGLELVGVGLRNLTPQLFNFEFQRHHSISVIVE